jgi:hypothetical protein
MYRRSMYRCSMYRRYIGSRYIVGRCIGGRCIVGRCIAVDRFFYLRKIIFSKTRKAISCVVKRSCSILCIYFQLHSTQEPSLRTNSEFSTVTPAS